jgi:chromosome segregation ATPase
LTAINNKIKSDKFETSKQIDDNANSLVEIKSSIQELKDSIKEINVTLKAIKLNTRSNKKRIVDVEETVKTQTQNPSSHISSTSNTSSNHTLDVAVSIETALNSIITKMNSIMATKIADITSGTRLISLMKSDNQQLDKYTESAINNLVKYSTHPERKETLIRTANTTIEQATKWSDELRTKYSEQNMHDIQPGDRITIEVTKFHEQGEQHVYDFLRDFKTRYGGRGTESVMAIQLWKSYLALDIQTETEVLKNDFQAITDYLIENFGDADTVVETILIQWKNSRSPRTETIETNICT